MGTESKVDEVFYVKSKEEFEGMLRNGYRDHIIVQTDNIEKLGNKLLRGFPSTYTPFVIDTSLINHWIIKKLESMLKYQEDVIKQVIDKGYKSVTDYNKSGKGYIKPNVILVEDHSSIFNELVKNRSSKENDRIKDLFRTNAILSRMSCTTIVILSKEDSQNELCPKYCDEEDIIKYLVGVK